MPNNAEFESGDPQYVEIYGTTIHRSGGHIRSVEVTVEYGSEDETAKNTVRFDCTGQVATFDGFEEPISDVAELRVIPAAEMVVRSLDGLYEVSPSFHVLETQFDHGFQAVDNRLEMENVPPELEAGVEAQKDE